MLKICAKVTLLSFCLLGCFSFGVPEEIIARERGMYMGRLRYLTTQGLYLTVITLFLGKISSTTKYFQNLYETMLAVCVPLEMLIVSLFWSLYFYNPRTLYQSDFYDKNIKVTPFGNLCVHLFPLFALIFEIEGRNLQRKMSHYFFIVLLGCLYFCLSHLFFYYENCFPYPFLDLLSIYQRIVVFFGGILIYLAFYEFFIFSIHCLKNRNKIKIK